MERQIMPSHKLRSIETCSEKYHKVQKKTPELVSSFIKNGRHCRCAPVNLENFDKTFFSQDTSGQLLLCCAL